MALKFDPILSTLRLSDVDSIAQKSLKSRVKVDDRFSVIGSAPTVTFGTATSSINGSYANGTVLIGALDERLDYQGSIFVDGTVDSGRACKIPSHITETDGSNAVTNAPIRCRFMTDAPDIEFCFLDTQFGQFNVIVDGEFIMRGRPITFGNAGQYRYIKVSFGTDAVTYGKASASLSGLIGGTLHATGDVITFDGGTGLAGGTPCQMKVTQAPGGVVSNMDVFVPGAYDAEPTGVFTQVSTTGSGIGCIFNAGFFQKYHSVRRMRVIELVYSHVAPFVGCVIGANYSLLPARANPQSPKVAFIGDSITIGTYTSYGACHMGSSIAQKLGWWDRHIVSGIGGTGWNVGTTKWSDPYRIQNYIDYDADIYVFIGSQNDSAGAPLEAVVTSTLNALQAARPNAYIVGIGNILGTSSTLAASIEAGFDAVTDQSKIRFINNQSPTAWIPSADASQWTVTSDGNHLGQEGMDRFATIAAEHIAQALWDMV